jgi:hypothetical protein
MAAPAEPSAAMKTAAQKVYQEGANHYKAGRFAEALAAFRASYEMVPSPNSHLMIARALRGRGALVEAYIEYDKLVPEADEAAGRDPKYAKAADAAQAERAKVRSQIALVKLRVKAPPDDLRIVVGAKMIGRGEWELPVPVPPGAITVRATSQSAAEQTRELSAAAGGEVEVTLDYSAAVLEPFPVVQAPIQPAPATQATPDVPRQPVMEFHPVNRTWAYVALGVGGAGFVTFAIFGALNQSTYHDLQAACTGGHCPADRADQIDRGRTQQLIANVGAGVGVAGGLLAIAFWASASDRGPTSSGAQPAPHPLQVTAIGLGPSRVAVRGTF